MVGQTLAEATSYTDTSVSGNTSYLYKIAAYNSYGAGYSNAVSITTLNRVPQLSGIADVIISNTQTATVKIAAADDSIDHVTLSVLNLPSYATFTDNGDGTGKVTITPTNNDEGFSNVTVIATDQENASDTVTFNILISNPNISSSYLSFSDGVNTVPKPWYRVMSFPLAGSSYTNIYDDANNLTGITLTFKNGFEGVVETGMQPVHGIGIYPNVVMRTGDYESTLKKDTIQISGLSASKMYNFVFFNSHNDGKNCLTNFTIGSKTVQLNASYNYSKTIQINGITPDTSGIVNIIVSKDSAADYAFISTLVIQSYAPAYTNISPAALRTTKVTRNSIDLLWQDRASTETGYQIWRAADSESTYTLIATVAAGVKTYSDANLTSNQTYTYTVRSVFGSAYSTFSNTVKATTYSYKVYINFTSNSDYYPGVSTDAPLPWNNLNEPPQPGFTWNNFYDEKGMMTGTGMYLTTNWSDISYFGINTGNNSGLYPDAVNIENYTEYPGQTATFQVTGLNLGMKYDFTFFGSNQTWANYDAVYTINGVTTVLNAALNISGTQTIYGVTPDNNGNVTITVTTSAQSTYAFLAALVIGGYTPSTSTITPSLPQNTHHVIAGTVEDVKASKTSIVINAFPNPFHDYYTLTFTSKNNISKTQVMMYDITGKLVYSNEVGNMHAGVNTLNVITGNRLAAGIYNVVIIDADTKKTQTIKVIKE